MRFVPCGLFFTILALWRIAPASADGVFFSYTLEVRQTAVPTQSAQQALIAWDKGVETLHLQSNYSGPPKAFSWVVPLPARPKVARSSWQLFTQAETISRPTVAKVSEGSHGLGCGCSAGMGPVERVSVATGVVLLETLDVAEFRVNVVSANEGGGFIRWLRVDGHLVPDRAKDVLQSYIDKGFFFVVVKIREDSVSGFVKNSTGNISTGLTPLALTFENERPFFPLAISSVSSAPENELLLLTLSSTPLDPVQYATTTLAEEDITKSGVGDAVQRSKSGNVIDLNPAVRLAQARGASPGLVLEAVVPVRWEAAPDGAGRALVEHLFPYESEKAPLYVTRLHGFLMPSQMRDITFTPARDIRPVWPYFTVHARAAAPPVPAALAGLSLCVWAASLRRRRNPRVRIVVLLLLALAACLA